MRTALTILTLAVICALAGCAGAGKGLAKKDNDILTVDFEQGQTLRYRFVARREVTIDWDPEKKMSGAGKRSSEKYTESLDVVMEYTPIEVDPFALTTIKVTCKSARASRSKRPSAAAAKDAVEHFAGKSYNLKIGPTGRIEDYSELDELIKRVGEKAFRSNVSRGRIKEPDMINDFIASQWFLWDSVSSIDTASDGLVPGQTWKSQLSLPSPMVMRKARDVVYTLDEIRPSPSGRVAVISSAYSLADSVPQTWPIPYSGSFRMSGTFGFLGGYNLLSIEGKGQELFNIDTGQSEQYNQQYELKISSIIPLGISAKPQITINQIITAKRL
ncbi:MAG: hypothetical protein ISS79_01690 [Phycisphaerae bacterium]|nr:hypothetical protein [Phycisphaerae bacterium]